MFNEFWQVVAKKQGTHVGTLMLNWLGYEGTNKTQKQKFTDYLKRQAIPFEELSSSDERVRLFPSMLKEIKEITTNNIERVKFLLMNSRDFQESDHEVVYQERKRYSRVLSQRRGIASRVRGIRASLRVKKKPKSSSSKKMTRLTSC
jgi:hypothetical protein